MPSQLEFHSDFSTLSATFSEGDYMRTLSAVLACVALFCGCSGDETERPRRVPVTLEGMAITVRGVPRSFMQSDKRGGVLVGNVGGGAADARRWSVEGRDLFDDLVVETARGPLTGEQMDSAVILPSETRRHYAGGTVVTESLLEGPGGRDMHGLVVKVAQAPPGTILLRGIPAKGIGSRPPGADGTSAEWRMPDGRIIVLTAGPRGTASGDAVSCGAQGGAEFLLVTIPAGEAPGIAGRLMDGLDSLLAARRARMERLLNDSYFRTSDDTLNRALQWIKVSLDGLMIDGRDTFAIAGVPWDGSIDVRANAQSIAGLGLATGDYLRTGAILRTMARYQDANPRSATYGRLPDRIAGREVTFRGADIAPWFVRELYEHVVYSNDTSLVRALYPVVSRSLTGTSQRHTDAYNFLTHGPHETWMSGVARGNRAVEVQLLWYFQQLIGSYVASFLGDTAHARQWWDASIKTSDNFAERFADTTSGLLADFLAPSGARDMTLRPNAIMCLEMLETERMRSEVTRTTVLNLLHPHGVATRAGHPPPGAGLYEGPVWTWLMGPVTYALTRYDRQDLSYQVTGAMARRVLTEGMAGTLPAIAADGPAGTHASLTGMAEFVRALYQDYLGLRVDLAANTLTIQPKLPDAFTEVDFTVYAGVHPIHGSLTRSREEGRIRLEAPDLPGGMKVNFLWMMDGGDAWRGTAQLRNGVPWTLVVNAGDVVLFHGDQKAECDAKRHLKNFSQRTAAAGFGFAP